MEVDTAPQVHGNNGDDQSLSSDGSFKAATRLQKVYRSYRTRRKLADSCVVAEELWWQLINFARLNYSTISFFENPKPETVKNKWTRIGMNASKVGQGLSKDGTALKLAFQHWIEAIDPQHRYGHNLHIYYDIWAQSQAGEPFFYWLDCGEGREVEPETCPRSLLRKQLIKYLGPQERENYEYVVKFGKIIHKQSGVFLDTSNNGSKEDKWIFVLSPEDKLYAGLKKKGMFHHSSFLAGGATKAAGRLTAENGVLKSVWAYSGHYKPGEEDLKNFIKFLRQNEIDVENIQIRSSSNEDYYEDPSKTKVTEQEQVETESLEQEDEIVDSDQTELVNDEEGLAPIEIPKPGFERSLSGGIKSPRSPVPKAVIMKRIESKLKSRSYQLAKQLSRKWSTGAGPRIGCVADYPLELRTQALEFTCLSPRCFKTEGPVSPAMQSVA